MTNEEALNILHNSSVYHPMYLDALNMAIEALEQQPCEDCISRQAVHEMLENIPVNESDKWFNWLQKACLRLADLPPVTPQPKIGHWMECGGDEPWLKGYCCSLCNFTTTQKYDYCICGAKMVESEDKDADSN